MLLVRVVYTQIIWLCSCGQQCYSTHCRPWNVCPSEDKVMLLRLHTWQRKLRMSLLMHTSYTIYEHHFYRLVHQVQRPSSGGGSWPQASHLHSPLLHNGEIHWWETSQILKSMSRRDTLLLSIVAVLVRYSNPHVCKLPERWLIKIVVAIELNCLFAFNCQRKVESNDEDNMLKSWCIRVWDMCLRTWDLIHNILKFCKFFLALQSILHIQCSSIPSKFI